MDTEKIERLRERLLVCPICMDEYKDPRLLPCHHTVCLECIQNYVQVSSPTGRMFRCPSCRHDICVPRGGIKEFPLNFYIISLQDELGTRNYNDTCDICKRDWLISQFRCVDCDMVICKFCIHEHRLFQHDVSRQYNIMRIEINPADLHTSSTRSCPKHVEELLQLYCCTCDKPVCITCMCDDHKKHETVSMTTKLCSARKHLQLELDRLVSDKRDVQKALANVQTTAENVSKWTGQAKIDIQERSRILHQKVDKLTQAHLSIVACEEQKDLHELDTYGRDLRRYCEEVDKGVRFLEDLQEGDMCLELLDCYGKFSHTLEEQKSKSANKDVALKQFTFHRGGDVQFLKYLAFDFGRLAATSSTETFLCSKRLSDCRRRIGLLHHIVTPGKFLLGLVALSMFITIVRLVLAYVNNPSDAHEVVVVLLFCVYLFSAAYFAYRKS